jgi:His-Xaa-Ser system protein HxsD
MPQKDPILCLDGNVHSLTAINRALYDFSGMVSMDVAKDDNDYVIYPLSKDGLPQNFRRELMDCIIEPEVRLELEAKYDRIRQIIVEQAIRPVDNDVLAAKIAALNDDL